MNTRSEPHPTSISGWLWLSALLAVVMVIKPFVSLGDWEWQVLLGLAGLWIVVKVWRLLRASSVSGGRLLVLLAGLGALGWVGVAGVPALPTMRFPALSQMGRVVLPLMLLAASGLAVLMAVAGLNRWREQRGASQRRSILLLAVNLLVAGSAWHVIRQPMWRQSLATMLHMETVQEQKHATEQLVHEWLASANTAATLEPTETRRVGETSVLDAPARLEPSPSMPVAAPRRLVP